MEVNLRSKSSERSVAFSNLFQILSELMLKTIFHGYVIGYKRTSFNWKARSDE